MKEAHIKLFTKFDTGLSSDDFLKPSVIVIPPKAAKDIERTLEDIVAMHSKNTTGDSKPSHRIKLVPCYKMPECPNGHLAVEMIAIDATLDFSVDEIDRPYIEKSMSTLNAKIAQDYGLKLIDYDVKY